MNSIRFYRDRDHNPRIQAEEEFFSIGEYLENDIQDTATGRDILALLQKNGENGEMTGNSYSLTITGNTVVLENLYDNDEPPQTLERAQVAALLEAWLHFLDQDGLLSLVPDF
jgi:hypothetical protein